MRALLVTLAATLLLITGCSATPTTPMAPATTGSQGPAPSRITTMPAVIGLRLDDAARKATARDLRVIVVVPRQAVSAKDASASGVYTGDLVTQTIVVAGIRRPFEDTDQLPQLVVSQKPAAGTELTAGATVTLTGGRHPGGDPLIPYLWQHQQVVKKDGASECYRCHTPESCSQCHLSVVKRAY